MNISRIVIVATDLVYRTVAIDYLARWRSQMPSNFGQPSGARWRDNGRGTLVPFGKD